jgi:tetratricopeptide (TPR) repeat protein
MNKKLLLIIYCTFFQILCFGQNERIDSLLILLRTDKPDTTKLIHLYLLSDECETIGNYSEGLNYAAQLIQLSDSILKKNNSNESLIRTVKKYKAKAYSNSGIIYDDQGNYPAALQNHFTSLKIMEEINDKKGIASSLNNIGIIYDEQRNFPEALKNYFASLEIKKSLGDRKGIGSAYTNIGVVYYNQDNLEEALKNYMAALKIKEELNDKRGISFANNNIGNVFSRMAEKENDPSVRKIQFDDAMKYYQTARRLFEDNGNKAGLASCYSNIGDLLFKQKKYVEAEDYLLKAKALALQIGYKDYLTGALGSLAKLDSAKGDFKSANENYKLYILYRDSLNNEETRKMTIQSQMTYDFEKKAAIADAEHKKELENQQILAEEKNRKQKIILSFVAGGFILLIAFAGFIFRSLRITRKQKRLIEKQKYLVEQQKENVERQKLLVEEKQKEIIDSIRYARRIQQSLLPSEKQIAKTLKRLNQR